jgi:phosphate transport system substrate-binding protein
MRMRRASAVALVGCAFLTISGCSGCSSSESGKGGTGNVPAAATRLNGAGSSFVNVIMTKWSKVYQDKTDMEVDYQSIGSGGGVQKLIDKTVDFGCSDAPLNEQQEAQAHEAGGEVVHIPLLMGGVVPCYNLKDLGQPLKFTGDVLARIYLGEITKWNDPAIVELNKGLTLPDLGIAVAHRSEASGTTFILTDYLSKVSPAWKEKVGKSLDVRWPCGVGIKDNAGLAGHVQRTEGAIGYVELIYALKQNIPYGSVRNAAGEDVQASLQSVTAAGDAMIKDIPADLKYSLTNAEGKASYPLAGTVWAVVFVKQPKEKLKPLVDFLRWATHEGQELAPDLQYATLPAKLVERVDAKLSQIHD